jgi:hypothetical protein
MKKPASTVVPERLLGVPDLCRLFKIVPHTVSVWVREGRIPRPIRIGLRSHWQPQTIARLLTRAEKAAPPARRRKAKTA